MKLIINKFESLSDLIHRLRTNHDINLWADEKHIMRSLVDFEAIFYAKYSDVRDSFSFKLIEGVQLKLTYSICKKSIIWIVAENVSGFQYRFPVS